MMTKVYPCLLFEEALGRNALPERQRKTTFLLTLQCCISAWTREFNRIYKLRQKKEVEIGHCDNALLSCFESRKNGSRPAIIRIEIDFSEIFAKAFKGAL